MTKPTSIYPSYRLRSSIESGGEVNFFPKTRWMDHGKIYTLKLVWHPYPKVMDEIANSLVKWNLVSSKEEWLSKALAAMELVYRSFDAMATRWESPFKIVVQDYEKKKPKNTDQEIS
jgi:hypothetical protein